jgi:hypothetical protein
VLVSRLTLNLVVHQGCNVVLKLLLSFKQDIFCSTLVNLVLELDILLKDLLVRICEIVLTAV